MQREIIFESREGFISQIKELGINKVVIADINEKRVMQPDTESIQLVQVQMIELLAYMDSTIYKCVIDGSTYEKELLSLMPHGFETVRRTRNIFK